MTLICLFVHSSWTWEPDVTSENPSCRRKRAVKNNLLHKRKLLVSMRAGAHAIGWYDWTEWTTTEKCSDSCGEENIKQTRKRSCNPTNFCSLPDEPQYSGGVVMAGKRYYCEQQGCSGRHATETRHATFDRACPCTTCASKNLYTHIRINYGPFLWTS